jgi:hypothetical protein
VRDDRGVHVEWRANDHDPRLDGARLAADEPLVEIDESSPATT